ncbi:hypothetical protein AAVH_27076 [Aphelenchoides avenae]|nr:hypothetical protein AAVH_27076 [Aphelenchus avenae]
MAVVASYLLYSNWTDVRRMAVRSVTPDWPTSMALEEKAKLVLYGLYFLYRDVWTLLMRRDRLSERQHAFFVALDTKASKTMSLYITPQSVSLSNELQPCPLVCHPEICRKDGVLSYKGGEIEADLERLIQLTEDTMHLADSLLFHPKDWEHRTTEFERRLRVVSKQHDSAALWLSTRWHRTWRDIAGEMHGE